MAAPTPIPTWATATNFTAPSETFDGTPTKVDPSAGERVEGWHPKLKPPAQKLNAILNLIGRWFDWLNDNFTPAQRTIALDIRAGHVGDAIGGDTEWTSGIVSGAYCRRSVDAGGTTFHVPIVGLPPGSEIVSIDVTCKNAAGGTPLVIKIQKKSQAGALTIDGSTTTSATAPADTAVNVVHLAKATPIVVDNVSLYEARIESSAALDILYGVELTFNDPTARAT